MEPKRQPLLKAFWSDGFGWLSLLAPAVAILYWTLKLWRGMELSLEGYSYAWGFLPIIVWVGFAYWRRWRAYDALAGRLETRFAVVEPFVSRTREGPPNAPRDESQYRPANFIHVIVMSENDAQIANCEVHVLRLRRKLNNGATDGTPRFKPFTLVTSAHHERSAVVRPKLPCHFDVLRVSSTDNLLAFTRESRAPYAIPTGFFDQPAVYEIDLLVSGDNTTPREETIAIQWDGSWEDIEAHRIDNG